MNNTAILVSLGFLVIGTIIVLRWDRKAKRSKGKVFDIHEEEREWFK